MRSTLVLECITGFVGAGAAIGATVIVPSLPVALYRPEILSSDLIPSIGLGIVALISIGAAYALLLRLRVGPFLGLAAGISLVEFKLVEAFAVGSVFTPPAGMGIAGPVLVWLQPLFIALGLAMIVLAIRAQRAAPPHVDQAHAS